MAAKPEDRLTTIKRDGRTSEYLPARDRLLWMMKDRIEEGLGWTIHSNYSVVEGLIVFQVRVVLEDPVMERTRSAQASAALPYEASMPVDRRKKITEKAETIALGRALALVGYGTEQCLDSAFSLDAPDQTDVEPDVLDAETLEAEEAGEQQADLADAPRERSEPLEAEVVPEPEPQEVEEMDMEPIPTTEAHINAIRLHASTLRWDRDEVFKQVRALLGDVTIDPYFLTDEQARQVIAHQEKLIRAAEKAQAA